MPIFFFYLLFGGGGILAFHALTKCFYFQIFSPYGVIQEIFIVRDEFKKNRGMHLLIL